MNKIDKYNREKMLISPPGQLLLKFTYILLIEPPGPRMIKVASPEVLYVVIL